MSTNVRGPSPPLTLHFSGYESELFCSEYPQSTVLTELILAPRALQAVFSPLFGFYVAMQNGVVAHSELGNARFGTCS